jgi:protein tyrosine phosphatase
VLPNEHTRVRLGLALPSVDPDRPSHTLLDDHCDYINANAVDIETPGGVPW